MRPVQGTGRASYVLSAKPAVSDWLGSVRHLVAGAPAWVLVLASATVVVAFLLVQYLTVRAIVRSANLRRVDQRRIRETEGADAVMPSMGMAGWVALCGSLVSLYGLWGFARETAKLPFLIALGFCAMFDVLELALFRLLYQTADPRKGRTPQYKLMHGTAWAQVSASMIANFVHAPNLAAAPFMAMMPAAAAWVIELELRKRMASDTAADEDKPQTGPIRLVLALWHKSWSALYSGMGVDAGERHSEMASRALGRRAAARTYELRTALADRDGLAEKVRVLGEKETANRLNRAEERQLKDVRARLAEVDKRVGRARRKAQSALDKADMKDPVQGLELMRRMAVLTRADEVARLDYGPGSRALEELEILNVTASAEFVSANKRASEANQRAEAADARQREADAAVQGAAQQLADLQELVETTRRDAEETAAKAAAEREQERQHLQSLREERERLEANDASTAQLYRQASDQMEKLREQVTSAQGRAVGAEQTSLRLQGQLETAQARLEALEQERGRLAREAADAESDATAAHGEAAAAREEALRLSERLAGLGDTREVQVVESSPEELAGRELLEHRYSQLTPGERAQSVAALARKLYPGTGFTEGTTRKYLYQVIGTAKN